MQIATSELQQARKRLAMQAVRLHRTFQELGTNLESLGRLFARTSRDQHREIVAQFHDCAGRLPYVDDRDYGALVLESVAETVEDQELRTLLLFEARFRATWCVQAASAGGEAIARATHLTRIEESLKKEANDSIRPRGDIRRTLDTLIDRWCERRALRLLQTLFRAYPGPLAHTDQLFELLGALRDVKGLCRAHLPEDELQMLIEAHNALEDSLKDHGSVKG